MAKNNDKFIWGAATASYQIEGAVTEDGRGESIWDRFSHINGNVKNGDTGDVACDHYHRYKEDIDIMGRLGLEGYRFSVAWSRIFPEGSGKVNPKGLDFYDRLIDGLLEKNIDPMVTLYHWDLPQALQDIGGWTNRDTVQYFVEYAQTLFGKFGDRVHKWVTHNEPWVVTTAGNREGRHAPGIKDFPTAVQVAHHLILSHAKAVDAYKAYRKEGDEIGITLSLHPVHPATNYREDIEAANRVDQYNNRWFLDPVFKGEYPKELLEKYEAELKAPVIVPGDMDVIANNPGDFLGVNYYLRKVVKHSKQDSFLEFESVQPEGRPYTDFPWEIYPEGMHELLMRIKNEYNNPKVYVTENGAAYNDKVINGEITDDGRIDYLKSNISEMLRAKEDGANVAGYYAWSLLDNFEWAQGYTKRFGLVYVDYNTQQRILKKSAYWYRDLIKEQK